MDMDELKSQEDQLRKEIATLSNEQKKQYFSIEEKRIKDPDTYAVLNYFFLAGLHHFYLGKYLFGSINLIAMLIGLLFIETFGWLIFVAVIVIELPQLFRSQKVVQKYNNQVMLDTLEQVR